MHFKQHKTVKSLIPPVPLDLINYKKLPSKNTLKSSALTYLNLNLSKQNKIIYGNVGLEALENGYLDQKQIESTRRYLARFVKREGKLWIRVFPDQSITKRAKDTRMGAGKGDVDTWVALIKIGRIIFEISGVTGLKASLALQAASYKLPIKTKLKMASRKKFIYSTFKRRYLKQLLLKYNLSYQLFLLYHMELKKKISKIIDPFEEPLNIINTDKIFTEEVPLVELLDNYRLELPQQISYVRLQVLNLIGINKMGYRFFGYLNQKLNSVYYFCSLATQFVLKPPLVRKNSLIESEIKPTNLVVMLVRTKKTWIRSWMSNPFKGPITFDRIVKAIDWLHSLWFVNKSKFPEKRELEKSGYPSILSLRHCYLQCLLKKNLHLFKLFNSKSFVELRSFRKKKTKWIKNSFRMWQYKNLRY